MLTPPVPFTHPRGEVAITFQIVEADGERVCGVFDLVGHIDLPPKAWLRLVRDTMTDIERKAKDAGCAEMRMAGRNWLRVFPDYEPLPGGDQNLIRKRL